LRVDDIEQITLTGIDEPYDDKLSGDNKKSAPSVYDFTQEVDRIHHFKHANYTNIQAINVVSYSQPQQHVSHVVKQSGHDSTVVWNPWISKSISMKDMNDSGYKTMLCIEAANTANVNEPLLLEPNHIHKLSQTVF
jgi:glucose-6-phosphate 1-epimerase